MTTGATQHYTKNTVEVSAWCNRCGWPTMHRVLGGKLAACLVCASVPETKTARPRALKPEAPAQGDLFGGTGNASPDRRRN
jgi:hypothetical protein